jgi:glycosyltransferase involved in cell wall biosynthesis
MNSRPRVALVRGPGLSVFELQSYEPLLDRYDLKAFGLAPHSVDTDGLQIPVEKLKWKDAIAGRSAMNAYRSRVDGARYYMPGLEKRLKAFDLIHSSEITTTFSWQCAVYRKKSPVPLVITSTENIRYPGWDDEKRAQFKAEVLSAADFFFALTPDARDVLLHEGVQREKIALIPFGIDLNRLKPSTANRTWLEKYRIAPDDFVITFAGRLVREKGIYDLASAIPSLDGKRLRVLYVGSGPERKRLDSFIEQRGLATIASIHDALPYGEMQNLYAMSHVVVLPSLPTSGLREQFGMTLVEAMACGKAVVATHCGSMPWVVGDAGLLVEPGSSQSLAESLNRLRSDAGLREELGDRGRRLAEERYDKRRVAEQIETVFRSLV